MKKFETRLSTGVSVTIEHIGIESLIGDFKHNHWRQDVNGWHVNPAHVVMVRRDVNDDAG